MKEQNKPRKVRSTVANIAGKEYVAFSTLYKQMASNISLKTFKGILESKGVKPTYTSGSTNWYDLKAANDVFYPEEYLDFP